MVSTRRMGSLDSAKAEAMLDAAEEVLREEGYAALTSRRIAEIIGVKQRLVYYYFQTMDDLALQTFRRLSARELVRLNEAVASERPLHEVWNICVNTKDTRMVSEFMALANRNKGLKKEVIAFIEESRNIQVAAIQKALKNNNKKLDLLTPEIAVLLGSSVALAMNREAGLGITRGHSAVVKMIARFCDSIEK